MRFLAAVADTGRLTTAAKALEVDHTTVARRVRILEQALGARLLERGHDGWDLTEAGRAVVEQGRAIQTAVERAAYAAAGAHADTIHGTVRVTSADAFGSLFVVPALARVRARHPSLSVELVTGASHLALRNLSFDIGVTLNSPPVTHLHTESLGVYDANFYASNTYLAEHGDPASLEELQQHTLIYFVDSLQRVRELDIGAYLPEPAVRFSSTNIFAQLEAVRLGVGIALLPKFIAITAPDIRLIAAELAPTRVSMTLALREAALARREVLVVREALHQEVQRRRHELIWPT